MRATYRLQLTPELGFRRARELVPYLQRLGVSHLYLSPSLQARPGSQHGYDVCDPTRISEDLGGEQAFRELAGSGLGVILDIVPNHMAACDENPFWADPELRKVFFDLDLRTGHHRRFFDIGELAGVRQEDEAVFETTHAKVLELVRDGLVQGIRIDHVDGLANPREYLERLQRTGVERVWVEKILEPGEQNTPHAHSESDDVIAILEGEASIDNLDTGETHDFSAGDVVFVRAGVRHMVKCDKGVPLMSAGGPCPPDFDMLRALGLA